MLACGAAAQAPSPEPAPEAAIPDDLATAGRDIAPPEWRAMVEGRTVWYRVGPLLWGRERYHPGSDRITFQFADGQCLDATWTWSEPWYCFDFGPALDSSGPHCFRHLDHDGRLWALGWGGDPQEIDRIDSSPLTCGPPPVS